MSAPDAVELPGLEETPGEFEGELVEGRELEELGAGALGRTEGGALGRIEGGELGRTLPPPPPEEPPP